MQIKAGALFSFLFLSSPRKRNAKKKKICVGGSCQLDILPLENLLEVSLSPLAWTCDAVYKSMESSLAVFPLMAEFTSRL